MSPLKLVGMLYSRKKIKELALAAEIFLMVILLAIALVPISNVIVFSQSLQKTLGGTNDLIYFTPSPTLGVNLSSDQLQNEQIEKLKPEDVEFPEGVTTEIYRTNLTYAVLKDEVQDKDYRANLLSYSENLHERIKLSLSSGDILKTKDGAVSVVISPELAQKYGVGDSFVSKVGDGAEEVEFFVTGILSKKANVLSFGEQGGTYIKLGILGGTLADLENKGYNFMIAVQNTEILPAYDWGGAAVFSVPKGTDMDSVIDMLNKKYSAEGSFHSYDSIYQTTIESSINDNEENVIMLFLFSIVLVFNYLGYVIINIKRKAHLNAILNICGLSFKRSVFINMLSVAIIVVPAVVLGLIFAPTVITAMRINYYGYNFTMYMAILLFFIITLIISVIVSFIRKRNAAIIKSYKEV